MSSHNSLYLFLVFALALIACSEKNAGTDSSKKAEPQVAEAAVATAAPPTHTAPSVALDESSQLAEHLLEDLPSLEELGFNRPWKGDLDGMEERRLIRVLTVYALGRYYLDDGEEHGLFYEVLTEYQRFLNKQLDKGHLKVNVIFVPMARDELIPALLDGRGDIVVASLSITPERQESVDFTDPISRPVSEILVTGPAAPSVESIEDLAGKAVFVRHSSSYRESLEALNERFQSEGLEPVKIEPIAELLEDDDLIEMVNSGLLPWAIVDNYKTQLWEGVFDQITVRDDIVFREGALIAWAIRKNSPKLKASLDKFMQTHRQGTLFGNVLYNRYIRDFDWAANALAEEDFGRLQDLADIFRNYGEQYGVDYLLAAAQGYQESRLRQEARSHTGAIGVMQMLPSTAKDPNVGIDDITEVDPNIHAGVRYLHFLRDRYFSDPAIKEPDRTFLALAAYNAGPARMINLRREAKQAGYDPNVWFDNVEVIAAKRVGRETVQYVSNIYKYYLAYRLALEKKLEHAVARSEAGITAAEASASEPL
ncbi:MAG: transporter substrate-binding domain-containing protein [Pseudomonadota bacterium]